MSEILLAVNQFTKEKKYWLEKLSGELNISSFPYDQIRDEGKNKDIESFGFCLPEDLNSKLSKVSKNSDTKLYMLLTTGVILLLNKYSNCEDVIIGTPIMKQEVEGNFVNTLLVLRNKLSREMTCKDFIGSVRQTITEAIENQNYPIENMISQLSADEGYDASLPLDVIVLLKNIQDQKYISNIKRSFMFTFEKTDGNVSGNIEYNPSRYNRSTVERISIDLIRVLIAVFDNIEAKISDIDIISEDEKQCLLYTFNNSTHEQPDGLTIQEVFEAQVEKTPDNIAIVYQDKELTYRQLNERANQLARILREKGVGVETIVGVYVERSELLVISILAVLKAGGTYFPIDTRCPRERILYMLEDSKTQILVTQNNFIDKLDFKGEAVNIDDLHNSMEENTNLISINSPENLAYVIYTSGSTGEPKGVLVEHRNLLNYAFWRIEQFSYSPNDVTLQLVSVSFDGFGANFYPAIFTGGKMVLMGDGIDVEVKHIIRTIKNQKVTNMSVVPSMYKAIITNSGIKDLDSLRLVVLAGEKTDKETIKKSRELNPNIVLANEYGPTENSIAATCLVGMTEDTVSVIGKPIFNNKILILDTQGKLVPQGACGELCISGKSVSRGYLNRFEMTKSKFVDNPYYKGERMYKTGDIARWLPEGNVELIGRTDNQVKIRGHRIELSEIEAKLLGMEGIVETSVIVKESSSGNKNICAFFVSRNEINIPHIRKFLSNILPEYMIPSFFIRIECIPRTSIGKIDRKVLNSYPINMDKNISERKPPNNDTEKKLLEIWKEVLEIDGFGVEESFFSIGGHSLNSTSLVSKMHEVFNVEVPLKVVFEDNTIRKLAEYIEKAEINRFSSIEPIEDKEYYSTSSTQRRIFILNQIDDRQINYNMPGAVIIEGKLDIEKVENVLKAIINRHEILRSSFETINGEPVQIINKETDFKICYEEFFQDMQMFDENSYKTSLNNIYKDFVKPFDLSKAPLLRVKLVKLQKEKYYMVYDIHHIISDGISMGILVSEFANLYNDQKLSALEIQYKDYAHWHNNLLKSALVQKQKDYWMEKLDGLTYTRLPQRNVVDNAQSEGAFRCEKIHMPLMDKIYKFCRKENITTFVLMLSILELVLCKELNQSDLSIGIPVAGRKHKELENLIGPFLNVLVLRYTLKSNISFTENVVAINTTVLEALDNQDYPYEELYSELKEKQGFKNKSLFSILFNYMPFVEQKVTNPNEVTFKQYDEFEPAPKYDMTFYVNEGFDGMTINIVYKSSLYEGSFVEKIIGNYISICKTVIENPGVVIKDISLHEGNMIEETDMDFDKYYENEEFINYSGGN